MSRLEAEARELLMQRRRMLRRGAAEGHDGDLAVVWSDQDLAPDPLSEGVRRELQEIDAALSRIEEGRYGACLSCGGPMGLQRLRAIPEARFCVSCSGQAIVVE